MAPLHPRTCEVCHVTFHVKTYRLKQNPRFCSAKCMGDAKRIPDETRPCELCGEPFSPRKSGIFHAERRFCSLACANKATGEQKAGKHRNGEPIEPPQPSQRKPKQPRVTLICPQCGQEFLQYPSRIKEGQTNYCSKACRGAAQRVEYTPEEKLARQAAYQRKHRAQFTQEELQLQWREEYYDNREARLESNARYKANNLEAVQAQQRAHKKEWGAENPEIIRERNQRYYEDNGDKWVVYNGRRRALIAEAPVNDLTPEQWEEILQAFDHRCAYCHKKARKLEQEHITPISKGGAHSLSNVVPACLKCNRQKHTGPPPVPVQPLLLTVAPAKTVKIRNKQTV